MIQTIVAHRSPRGAYVCTFCDHRPAVVVSNGLRAVALCATCEQAVMRALAEQVAHARGSSVP